MFTVILLAICAIVFFVVSLRQARKNKTAYSFICFFCSLLFAANACGIFLDSTDAGLDFQAKAKLNKELREQAIQERKQLLIEEQNHRDSIIENLKLHLFDSKQTDTLATPKTPD